MYGEGGIDLAEAPLSARENAGLDTAVTRYIVGLEDVEIAFVLQEDWKNSHGLGLRDIHENAKMQHWAKERRKENEQRPRRSTCGARPDAGIRNEDIASLFANAPSLPGQPTRMALMARAAVMPQAKLLMQEHHFPAATTSPTIPMFLLQQKQEIQTALSMVIKPGVTACVSSDPRDPFEVLPPAMG